MDYLNNVGYPDDYIVKGGPDEAEMTSGKTFRILKVSDLQGVETINDIDADDFIILNADQSLEHPITFENLIIDESLQVKPSRIILVFLINILKIFRIFNFLIKIRLTGKSSACLVKISIQI